METSPKKRTLGVGCTARCFILFGVMNTLSYLNLFLLKLRHGGLRFEIYKQEITRVVSQMPLPGGAAVDNIWEIPQVKALESFFDFIVTTPAFNFMIDGTLILSIFYVFLGIGLWKLKPWSWRWAVKLHLILIPVQTIGLYILTQQIWTGLGTSFPDWSMDEYSNIKNFILISEAIVIAVTYLLLVAYFYLPKVKSQFN